MQEKKTTEQRESAPKPEGDAGPVSQASPPSEPFFDSGIREEKAPRSGEEHGGAADAGHERWAHPGTKEGPPPELAKPTGTATGAPSETPKGPPGPDADEGDGLDATNPDADEGDGSDAPGPDEGDGLDAARGVGADDAGGNDVGALSRAAAWRVARARSGAGRRRDGAAQAWGGASVGRRRGDDGSGGGGVGCGGGRRAHARPWTAFRGGDTCAARMVDSRPSRPYTPFRPSWHP